MTAPDAHLESAYEDRFQADDPFDDEDYEDLDFEEEDGD